jgi:D-lactate dehydrogenase (cytochrome)
VNVVEQLQNLLGDQVHTDPATRELRAHDWSHHEWELPDVVVSCRGTEDVATVLRLAHVSGTPVVPIAAGTGLEGGANSSKGSIALDLSTMDRILDISEPDLDATVQAGVMKSALNAALAEHGLIFPVGPGVDASVGGMASTGASGTTAVRYGTLKDNVLGLTVVLADGRVVKTGGRSRKSSAGYDLTRLFVGAEGTLGVLTELTVKVRGIPAAAAAAICGFADLGAAARVVQVALKSGVPISRVELLDETTVDAVNRFAGLTLPIVPTLLFEFEGSSPRLVREQAAEIEAIAAELGSIGFEVADDPAGMARLWQARHDALPAYCALVPGSVTWSTDVCVPVSRLAECITLTAQDTSDAGVLAPIVGHVGDGNFHLAFVLVPGDDEAYAKASAVNERLVERALAMGGTCTGEHGIGTGKVHSLAQEHPTGVPVMALLKNALDPTGILNPGKVLAAR